MGIITRIKGEGTLCACFGGMLARLIYKHALVPQFHVKCLHFH